MIRRVGQRADAPVRGPAKQTAVTTPTLFTPTNEQQEALRLFATGENVAIEAGAGTGKTSTLILLAKSTPRRGQYIAFNKAIVVEAEGKMPDTVHCSTAHSLAYRAVGYQYRERLGGSRRMRSLDIAKFLDLKKRSFDVTTQDGSVAVRVLDLPFLGGLVMATVVRFCQSADTEISVRHVPYVPSIDVAHEDGARTYANNNRLAAEIVPYAVKAWADLARPIGNLPFKHDHYLKLWQLGNPRINADYILFDECQDANPVILAIVEAQRHAQRVYVGDSQQQIYAFTGAVNALDRIREQGAEKAYLSQSFRFGSKIAAIANTVLDGIPNAKVRLVGSDSVESIVDQVGEPDALLARTNAAAVRAVIRMQANGVRVALVGGGDDVTAFARSADDLMNGRTTTHPELACFATWKEVQTYVEEDKQGGDLKLFTKLVDDFGVQAILAALGRSVREEDADVVVSTVHKAKGREWGSVRLANDFAAFDKMSTDERRLLYVAVTRAKNVLDISAVDGITG